MKHLHQQKYNKKLHRLTLWQQRQLKHAHAQEPATDSFLTIKAHIYRMQIQYMKIHLALTEDHVQWFECLLNVKRGTASGLSGLKLEAM